MLLTVFFPARATIAINPEMKFEARKKKQDKEKFSKKRSKKERRINYRRKMKKLSTPKNFNELQIEWT